MSKDLSKHSEAEQNLVQCSIVHSIRAVECIRKYTDSLVNGVFGSGEKSCKPKIALSKLSGISS